MPYKFNPLSGNFDIVNPSLDSPLQFKGSIAVSADFPTVVAVETGWFYKITADVTDNDAAKTNTGQSFVNGDEIAWNGTNWTPLGNENVTLQEVTDNGATTTNSITIDNGGLTNNVLNLNGATHSYIRSTATDLLQLGHGGSARITIDGSGEVGIGTTSPSANLHVVGTELPVVLFERTYAGSGAMASSFSLRRNNVGAMDGDGTGFLYEMKNSAGSYEYTTGLYSVMNDVTSGTEDSEFQIHLLNSGSFAGRFTFNANQQLIWSGYTPYTSSFDMGLGVQVNKNAISGMDFKNSNAGGQVRLMARSNDNSYIVINNPGTSVTGSWFGLPRASSHYLWSTRGDGSGRDLGIGTLGADDVVIGTDGTERIKIHGSGATGRVDIADRTTTIGATNIANAYLLIGDTTRGVGIDNNEIYAKGDNMNIGTIDSGDSVRFLPGGSPKMIITSTGDVGVGTESPNSTLCVEGSLSTKVNSYSSTHTVTADENTIICTANTFTVTLPTAVGIGGRIYNIKNIGTGVITIDGNGTETIDGNLTVSLPSQYDKITVQSNGTNWIII